ncbi:Hypothetical protein SRAE_1000099000 [Strongyloides ratti]|uniref:Uncharacterized protein n=1 Tax=Strongyloides ratti TaxID=34506 RepID=A0A090KZ05_STRRB|nr:Hypothetical protein SRAE_1000099000 [Strongyloides ratti]CEF62720.1 Hypothetical protein SRAE_1000099000 [Strongyloides ratti]
MSINNFEHLTILRKKIFFVDLEDIKDTKVENNNTYGFSINIKNISYFYNIGKTLINQIGNSYGEIFCQWHTCDLGVKFFDKKIDKHDINNSNEKLKIDYAIIFSLKRLNNKLYLGTMFYYKEIFFYNGCPVRNYIKKESGIKYYAYKHVYDNGIDLPNYNMSHLFLPIFPQYEKETFFSCGWIEQTSLPNIEVGFYLEESFKGINEITNNSFNIELDQNCYEFKSQFMYSFIYTNEKSNILNLRDISKNINNSINYFGQKLYFFNMKNFEYSHYFDLKKPKVQIPYSICIQKSKVYKAIIIPVLENFEDIKLDNTTNEYYQLINSSNFNELFKPKCILKMINEKNEKYKEFYSKAINFTLKKINNFKKIKDNNIIFENDNLEIYGKYSCVFTKKAELITDNFVEKKDLYILPLNGTIFKISLLNVSYQNIPSFICSKMRYSVVEKMNIYKVLNNSEDILLYSGSLINLQSEDKLMKKLTSNIKLFKVLCEYNTKVGTKISTVQNFIFHSFTKMNKNNIILVFNILVILIIIIVILIIMTYFIFVKRTPKNKENYKPRFKRKSIRNITSFEMKNVL